MPRAAEGDGYRASWMNWTSGRLDKIYEQGNPILEIGTFLRQFDVKS